MPMVAGKNHYVMNVLSLFDGMSCGRIALERARIPVTNYFASEIDPYAIKVSKANWPDIIQIGDVRNVSVSELPKIDLLIGGSPCQGFSFAGKGLNFDDSRSGLFFEFVRILKECKPQYFLLENVRMLQAHQDVISKYLMVNPIFINSALLSSQNRKRLYWTNIPGIEQPEDRFLTTDEICKTGVPVKPKSQTVLATIYKENAKSMVKRKKWGLLVDDCGILRKYNPDECELLQSMPPSYTNHVSPTRRYIMIGNGWEINTIAHIFKNIPK